MATEYDDEADGSPGKEVLLPVWNKPEPYFEFMDKLKPILSPGKNPWRVASDDKRISTHKLARTRKCLVAIHPHAIAISSPYGRDRSLVWFAVVLLATFSAMFAYSLITELMSDVVDIVGVSICIFAIVIFFFCGMWAFNFAARMPSDWPIMFNKVDRTVSFIRPTRPKFFKFWQFTNSGVVTYPWDTVKVRSYKVIVSNAGKSFHESYYLVLFWGGQNEFGKKVVMDCVPIGYFGYFEDERLFQVWEHIRRYMEEEGPPIQSGEQLRKPINNRKPMAFPPEVIAAAGGPALSVAEVERLAGVAPEG
ncbi:hypothetical protein LBW60_14735 [Ralstonia solanacearum]|uniref:DUF6708 domain-containing protein n=1 Tax=Ralstonia solanacearum TaxID=305 RepID=UPI00230651B4|nr:DUF6708 domain-containing protein [Ralstonia solanacearum]MDB0514580.1 hypothetical protein [Ralstonia solanacearum]